MLVLADELTGALDTRTSFELMALFQSLNRAGMTNVIVTHEQDIARFAVGVFFDWYPARKAARLSPIEALRFE